MDVFHVRFINELVFPRRYPGADLLSALSKAPGSRARYDELRAHCEEVMNDNRYSVIDMGRLFGGFYNVKAASFRHKGRAF